MSDELQASMAAKGEEELEKYFAGAQLEFAKQVLAANIAEQSSGQVRTLAAGINNIDIASIDVDGNLAHVEATGVVWAQFAQLQEDGTLVPAHPDNGMIFELTLQRSDGSWFVVDEIMQFAPGESQ